MNQCRKIEERKEELTSTIAAACRLFTIINRVGLWDKMWGPVGVRRGEHRCFVFTTK